MATLVKLQVIMVYLSTWNLSLVTVDLPSFQRALLCCVLARRRERMVWGLSGGVVVHSERTAASDFLRAVCGWPSVMYCFL